MSEKKWNYAKHIPNALNWPLHFISFINVKFDGRTNGTTNQRTDKASYRDASKKEIVEHGPQTGKEKTENNQENKAQRIQWYVLQ